MNCQQEFTNWYLKQFDGNINLIPSMITECNNSSQDYILNYIGEDYPKCLYLYLDLLKYGCASSMTRTWIQSHEGTMTSVMLSYHTAVHVYSRHNDFDVEELVNLIREIKPTIINARVETINRIECALKQDGYLTEFGHIGEWQGGGQSTDNSVQLAEDDDIPQVAQLLFEDEDIGASYIFEDLLNQMRERLRHGFVRSYVIRDGRRVLAHIGTGAETETVCTLAYGITAADQRGKGLASKLFAHACVSLKAEGKRIFSVYYPDKARRLHYKMGFVDVCEFGKLYKNVQ